MTIVETASRRVTTGAVALMSLIAFENLAVTTTMPAAAEALRGLAWYALAFAAPLATGLVAMVVAGRWSDGSGPVAPLWTGAAWFGAGSVLCGLSPDMWTLLAGRAVLGFGGGLVTVALYVVVGRVYPSGQRPRIFALFAAAWVLPSIVGPPLAGAVVESVGWRWVFLLVPALLVPAVLVMRPGLRGLATAPAGRTGTDPAARRRLLAAGAAAASVLLLHVGAQNRTATGAALVALGLAGVAVSAPRLVPAGTFRVARGLPAVVALRGLMSAAFTSAEVFVPLLLIRERGLSPTVAGTALTVAAVAWFGGSWCQSRLGRPVGAVAAGMALLAAGSVAAAVVVVPAVPAAVALVGWTLAGTGMGLAYPALPSLLLDLSPAARHGADTSAMQMADSLFSAALLAVGGSLFASLIAASPRAAYLAGFAIPVALAIAGAALAGRLRPGAVTRQRTPMMVPVNAVGPGPRQTT